MERQYQNKDNSHCHLKYNYVIIGNGEYYLIGYHDIINLPCVSYHTDYYSGSSSFIERQLIQHLHLSFDVDAFDPQLFPATSVQEQEGLLMEDFEEFISVLPTLPKMIALDFVEYNSLLDNKNIKCTSMANHLLETLLPAPINR